VPLHGIYDIAVDAVGNVWFGDSADGSIYMENAAGTKLTRITNPSPLNTATTSGNLYANNFFGVPCAMAFDGAGNLYASFQGNGPLGDYMTVLKFAHNTGWRLLRRWRPGD
jgi:hypothetical protein